MYTGENDSFAKLPATELLGSFVDPFVIFHSGVHEVPKLGKRFMSILVRKDLSFIHLILVYVLVFPQICGEVL